MIDVKFTKERFKNHFYYAKWMYMVFVALGVLIFSMVFTFTRPVVPKEFRLDISVMGFTLQDAEKNIWEEEILATLSEDQQEVNIYSLGFGGSEDTMGGYSVYEILAARMAAKEDDIYIMPRDIYLGLASQGAFTVMDDFITEYEYPEELDLEEYKVELQDTEGTDGQPHFYGLPLDSAMGLVDMGVDPRESVIGVLVYTVNYDNALKAVDYIMHRTESAVINSAQAASETDGP
jgi:hypothetical protein